MIPLKDSPKTRRFPIVNTLLIALNIYVFMRQLGLTEAGLHGFVLTYGMVPAQVSRMLGHGAVFSALSPLVSYQFLHGGWLHIGSNMLYLWVFGDNIEDRLGHLKYLFFYLLMGILAGLVQMMLDIRSAVPVIGASGAVAGVLGAYLVSCPRARVLAIIPLLFIFTLAELPAVIFLGFWFVLQLFSGLATIGVNVSIAWWAHIGGFLAGVILINFFGKKIHCE